MAGPLLVYFRRACEDVVKTIHTQGGRPLIVGEAERGDVTLPSFVRRHDIVQVVPFQVGYLVGLEKRLQLPALHDDSFPIVHCKPKAVN